MLLHRIGDAGANCLTPGILPCALRVSFAVRADPAAQWLLLPTNRLERFEPRMRPRVARVSPKDGAKVNKSDTRVSAEALLLELPSSAFGTFSRLREKGESRA